MQTLKQIKFRGLFALLLLLYALDPIMPYWYNQAYLFFIFPVLFGYSIIVYPRYIVDDKVFRYFFYYFLFSLLTITWAVDKQLSYDYLRFHIGVFVVTYVFALFSTNNRNLSYIHLYYFVYLGACLFLGFTSFGFANIDLGSQRAEGSGLNANRFGYFVFFITFLIYYFGDIKPDNTVFKYLFFITIPLSFYIAFITASRQLLIIQVPYITFLLLRRYTKKFSVGSILFFLLIIVLILAVSDSFISIYKSSYLSERMGKSVDEDSRTRLLRLAFKIGNDHFFSGVGLANFRLYSNGYISHCSYAEAYAEGGIFQLLLYIMIIVSFLKNQIKRYKISKDKTFILFFVTGLFYAAFNVFYVFQSYASIMAFIFIMESDSKLRFNKLTNMC